MKLINKTGVKDGAFKFSEISANNSETPIADKTYQVVSGNITRKVIVRQLALGALTISSTASGRQVPVCGGSITKDMFTVKRNGQDVDFTFSPTSVALNSTESTKSIAVTVTTKDDNKTHTVTLTQLANKYTEKAKGTATTTYSLTTSGGGTISSAAGTKALTASATKTVTQPMVRVDLCGNETSIANKVTTTKETPTWSTNVGTITGTGDNVTLNYPEAPVGTSRTITVTVKAGDQTKTITFTQTATAPYLWVSSDSAETAKSKQVVRTELTISQDGKTATYKDFNEAGTEVKSGTVQVTNGQLDVAVASNTNWTVE